MFLRLSENGKYENLVSSNRKIMLNKEVFQHRVSVLCLVAGNHRYGLDIKDFSILPLIFMSDRKIVL